MPRGAGVGPEKFEVNPETVRFGIFHAKYAKGGKGISKFGFWNSKVGNHIPQSRGYAEWIIFN